MTSKAILLQAECDALAALTEDASNKDLLAEIAPRQTKAVAEVIANEACILAGCEWFDACFRLASESSNWQSRWSFSPAELVPAGSVVVTVEAHVAPLLAAERSALNFLALLSATATIAKSISQATEPVPVYDTRKTIPLLRAAQKYAAELGGMHRNRANLAEAAIIKENHIRAAGSVTKAWQRATILCQAYPLQLEVASLAELDEAIAVGAKNIMLDNFSLNDIHLAVAKHGKNATLEASGSITASNAADYAKTGIARLSSSAATKGAGTIDFSMRWL